MTPIAGIDRKSTICSKPDNFSNQDDKANYKVHCDFHQQGFADCEELRFLINQRFRPLGQSRGQVAAKNVV